MTFVCKCIHKYIHVDVSGYCHARKVLQKPAQLLLIKTDNHNFLLNKTSQKKTFFFWLENLKNCWRKTHWIVELCCCCKMNQNILLCISIRRLILITGEQISKFVKMMKKFEACNFNFFLLCSKETRSSRTVWRH